MHAQERCAHVDRLVQASVHARNAANEHALRPALLDLLAGTERCVDGDVVVHGEAPRKLPRDDGHGTALRARGGDGIARLADERDAQPLSSRRRSRKPVGCPQFWLSELARFHGSAAGAQ